LKIKFKYEKVYCFLRHPKQADKIFIYVGFVHSNKVQERNHYAKVSSGETFFLPLSATVLSNPFFPRQIWLDLKADSGQILGIGGSGNSGFFTNSFCQTLIFTPKVGANGEGPCPLHSPQLPI